MVSERALELHRDAVVIDLHADTLELVRLGYDLAREHQSYAAVGHRLGHVDLPRLRRGGVTGQFFGIVIPPWSTRRGAPARVGRQTELLERACAALNDEMRPARTAEEVLEAHRTGRIAALLGVEGSYGLAHDPACVERLAALGVRYLGPAHLAPARAGPSSMWPRDGQLDEAGRRLVAELERWSVLIDLAHLARPAFLEVCRGATQPVLVSHAGAAALNPIWRNIDDDQIRAVADTGGVIGVIMTRQFLGLEGADGVAAHVEHLVQVGGLEVAALGSDFDGLIRPPADVRDVAGLASITDALLRRGVSERVVRAVLGENVVRLLRAVPPGLEGATGGVETSSADRVNTAAPAAASTCRS